MSFPAIIIIATIAGRATLSPTVATTLRRICTVLQCILARFTVIKNDFEKKVGRKGYPYRSSDFFR